MTIQRHSRVDGGSEGYLGGWSWLSRSLSRGSFGSLGCLCCLLAFLRCLTAWSGLSLSTVRRRPEGEVVAKELHDQSAITVGLLRKRVELGDGIIESLLGQMASTIGRIQDLVIEHREIEGKAKTDRVGRGELGLGNIRSVLSYGE